MHLNNSWADFKEDQQSMKRPRSTAQTKTMERSSRTIWAIALLNVCCPCLALESTKLQVDLLFLATTPSINQSSPFP